jgi:hypothetical protein
MTDSKPMIQFIISTWLEILGKTTLIMNSMTKLTAADKSNPHTK